MVVRDTVWLVERWRHCLCVVSTRSQHQNSCGPRQSSVPSQSEVTETQMCWCELGLIGNSTTKQLNNWTTEQLNVLLTNSCLSLTELLWEEMMKDVSLQRSRRLLAVSGGKMRKHWRNVLASTNISARVCVFWRQICMFRVAYLEASENQHICIRTRVMMHCISVYLLCLTYENSRFQ